MSIDFGAILDKARAILKGEPARAIGYGAAAIIYLVALAFQRIPDMTPDQALVAATAAITTLVGIIETIRRFVYSPATVDSMVEEGAAVMPDEPPVAGPDDPVDGGTDAAQAGDVVEDLPADEPAGP